MAEYGVPLPHLRAWRMHRLMNQDDLARAAGISRSTILRAETGDEIVRFANVRKLAEALKISPEQLVNERPAWPVQAEK